MFHANRVDPLGRELPPDGLARMDAFAGNMPFIGGRCIATIHGERYAEWLCQAFDATGEVDYVTYFFLRANQLLGTSGTIGLIATNSISQGDTRRNGLQRLLSEGLIIYDAQNRLPWPGEAGVLVAPVLLAKGACQDMVGVRRLNGKGVPAINSRLRTYAESADPSALQANGGVAFVGCFLRGEGFVLSKEEASGVLAAGPEEQAVVRPYLVGEDIAKDPLQRPARFVIDFAVRELEDARRYGRAMAILEERVRPDRERLKTTGADAAHRRYWWRFANTRVDLRAWLGKNPWCLVLPRVAKHLLIARVPTDQVFSEQVVVFGLQSMTAFAMLQSRIHEIWARLLSSTMGEGLRYSATDCFDTFPFPLHDPRTDLPAVERAGEHLAGLRAEYMVRENVGLTTLYNRMKDPTHDDMHVVALRTAHEEIDVAAYAEADPTGRWREIAVPSHCSVDGDTRLEVFEDRVIDSLFELNHKRALEETQGSGVRADKQKKDTLHHATVALPKSPRPARSKKGTPDGQGNLPGM